MRWHPEDMQRQCNVLKQCQKLSHKRKPGRPHKAGGALQRDKDQDPDSEDENVPLSSRRGAPGSTWDSF